MNPAMLVFILSSILLFISTGLGERVGAEVFTGPPNALAATSTTGPLPTTSGVFRPSFFPVGVYVYGHEGTMETLAAKQNMNYQQWLEATFGDLAARQCNSVYLANLSDDPDAFKIAADAASKKGLAVFAQLTASMYLRPSEGTDYFNTVTLKAAEKFLPQYRDIPGVVAWAPMEEPVVGDLPLLSLYRRELRRIDGQRSLYTLHNTVEPMQKDSDDLPEWFGFERYRFKSMFGDYGILLSTPKDMAIRLRGELAQFTAAASSKGRPLIFVIQGTATDWLGSKEDLLKLTYGVTPTRKSGWRERADGKWYGWTKYPPPRFGMRFQCWLGILEGVKGFLVYKYNSTGDELGKRQVAMVAADGSPSSQWIEFGETISQIKPLFPLFLRWEKESTCAVLSQNPEVFVRSFIDGSDQQRYVVVVNSHVADWDKDSPALPTDATELIFDEQGLQGLREAGSLVAQFTLDGGYKVKDHLSGETVPVAGDKTFQLSLPPGGGKVLLLQGDKPKPLQPENLKQMQQSHLDR